MRVTIKNTGRSVSIQPHISVLVACQREGIPLPHVCGGKTQCGTCAVKVVSGGEFLSPVLERERTRLDAMKLGPEYRLACQCYCWRDIEIEIPERDAGAVIDPL